MKTSLLEDNLTGRQACRKTSLQEDDLTGRKPHRKTNSREDELGTAQPQLVSTKNMLAKLVFLEVMKDYTSTLFLV